MRGISQFLLKYKRFILLYTLALIIRLIFAIPFVHDWDGFVFSESAKNFLRGETPYMTVLKNDPSIYPDSDKPMIQQWYAYPPLPLLMFTAPLAVANFLQIPLNSVTENVLLKLPFILGDLLAALLVRKFLEKKSEKFARRAELLILFNPLIIWVSSAWGMFDIWMANFLLLFLLSVRKSQVYRAGFFLALACTTKLFPVFFLPIITVYILRTSQFLKDKIKLFITFIVTASIIIIPFLVTSPRGFLNQNLLMHIQRPPQGLSIPAIFDYYKDFYNFPSIPVTQISSIVMLLSIVIVFLAFVAKTKNEEKDLIFAMIATFIATLLFNKVANEQYFVLLIVLLIIYLFRSTEKPTFLHKILYLTKTMATYGVLFVSVFLGFHFLGFLLPDVTQQQLKASANQLVFYLSNHFNLPLYSYPDSPWTFYNLPSTLSSFVMLPFIILGVIVLIISLKEVILLESFNFSKLLKILSIFKKPRILFISLSLFLIGIIFGVTTEPFVEAYIIQNQLFTPVNLISASDFQPLPQKPSVGTFYNVWWNNFSHYKNFPYGDWNNTTLTPEVGYYTSKNSYYVEHIRKMKEANIDFVLIPYHLYDRKRYLTFGYYAEKLGIYYSPVIESFDALAFDEFRPVDSHGNKFLGFSLSNNSKETLKNVILSSLADNLKSSALFHVNGKPAVFVYDAHWFYPSWDNESKSKLSKLVIAKYSDDPDTAFSLMSKDWGTKIDSLQDVTDKYPTTVEEFSFSTPHAIAFRQAFLDEHREFWSEIKESVEEKFGSIYLVSTYTASSPFPEKLAVIQAEDLRNLSVFDAEFFYSVANTWVSWQVYEDSETIKKQWQKQVQEQVDRSTALGQPKFLTVTATYNDKKVRPLLGFEIPRVINEESTYDWAWRTALQYNPDYVLVTSWNEFFEGTAIEPSKEYGDFYIKKTAEWVVKYKQNNEH